MKNLILFLLFCLIISVPALSQTKNQLESQIKYLITEQKKQTVDIQTLKDQFTDLKLEIKTMHENNIAVRLQAIDQKNNSTIEPNSTNGTSTTTKSSTDGTRIIQTGSRGGKYYINKNGNKTYIKH